MTNRPDEARSQWIRAKARAWELFLRIVGPAVVAYWRRRYRGTHAPAHQFSMAPSDNIQRAMNLVMPLRDPSAIGRARLIQMMAAAGDEVAAGLHNTAVVHFGRFTLVDGNLIMFSVYDGDFENYIRDFIYNIGGFFTALMDHVDRPAPTPVEHHPDAFVEWVRDRDALQLPEDVTALGDDLDEIQRRLVLTLDPKRNRHLTTHDHMVRSDVQIFLYRNYPGYSVPEIRDALQIGW